VTDYEVFLVAKEWAAIFNQAEAAEVAGLISEAAAEECFDDRTNLFLMTAVEPTDMALVLSASPGPDGDYMVVRFDGEAWVVDGGVVDWDALEDTAFAADDSDTF